jgi:hypothetical protein
MYSALAGNPKSIIGGGGQKKAKFCGVISTPLDFHQFKHTYLSLRYAPSDSAARMALLDQVGSSIMSRYRYDGSDMRF